VAWRDGSSIQSLGAGAGHPSWHPDGDHFFALALDAEGITRFMLYPLDGSPPRALGPDWLGDGHPSFEPNQGRYLAVDICTREHVFLRLYDTQEGTFEDVLVADYTDYSNFSGTHFHPAWAPDGRSLYISTAHTPCAGVYRVDLF
jgi:Tol biopolymer transport system component